MSRLRENAKIVAETQFNLENISKEIMLSKKAVAENCSDKVDLITKMIDSQVKLTGLYYHQAMAKQLLRMKYAHNILLANVVMNQPYLSLSIRLLVKQTFFGSARVLLRQFFEGLLMAKYGEQDEALVKKWDAIAEGKGTSAQVSLSRDVFVKLEGNKVNILELRKTWKSLNLFAHPTRYAQQVLRLPVVGEEDDEGTIEKWRKGSNLLPNVEYTLDMHFMLLCMNFHLLTSHWGRKTRRWYFGYDKDPYGSHRREKILKSRHKNLVQKYFQVNKRNKGANELLKRNIRQYRQSWIVLC